MAPGDLTSGTLSIVIYLDMDISLSPLEATVHTNSLEDNKRQSWEFSLGNYKDS